MTTQSSESKYGKYVIRTMQSGDLWRSRALKRDKPVGAIMTAPSAEASILAVQTALDEIIGEGRRARGADGYPTTREVKDALLAISISKGQQDMLSAHLSAREQIITATQLAAAAGYESFGSANLQYGLLAKSLAEEMDWTPEILNREGMPVWTFVIAVGADDPFVEGAENSHEWRWKMRPQVMDALKQISFT